MRFTQPSSSRLAGRIADLCAVAVVCGACSGCSCSKANEPVATTDAATTDARADGFVDTGATADSRIDSTRDIGPSDTVDTDAPYSGEWITVPGAPAECGALLAADPAVSAPALKWKPCASGRVGCQSLAVDWSAMPGYRTIAFRDSPVRSVAGVAYMDLTRIWPDAANNPLYTVESLQPLDAAAVLAVRFTATASSTSPCAFVTSIGDVGPALLGRPVGSGSAYAFDDFLAWATWSAPGALSLAIVSHVDEQAPAGGGVSVEYSAGHLFVQTTSPRGIIPFDTASGGFVKTLSAAEHQVGIRDGVLAVGTADPISLALIRGDGTSSVVAHPEAGRIVSQQAIDRANGDAIVWIESDVSGFSYVNPTIWTAPYTTSETTLVRRKVAKFTQDDPTGGAGMVVNAGVALNLTGATTALLTRLSDGMGWSIAAEPGDGFALPLWVDDKEVWLATADPKLPSFKSQTSGIVRITRDSLGSPTIPPGI